MLVSYWFPPAVGAAAERIHAFAEYLPAHAWHPRVLTAQHPGPAETSERMAVQPVPDRLAAKRPIFSDYDPRVPEPSRWKTWLRGFVFPDRFLAWRRAAFKVGKDLLQDEPCDLILASFPPASAVLLALDLHRHTGTRLVLDFRDRWIGPGGYEPRRAKALQAHKQLEREAIASAAALLTISEAMADALAEEHGYDRRRIFVIPNGYEPASMAPPSSPATADAALTIAHVGTVIPRNRPDLFFKSVAALKGDARLRGVRFRFVGNLSPEYLVAAGLSSLIETTGLRPRAEARHEMQSAHALLLLTGAYVGKWGYNAKIFEYVQTGRPILCLEEAPAGNDRKLLERFAPDRAFFASVDDPEAIARQIEMIRRHVCERAEPAIDLDDAFRSYSRPELVARLADCLHGLMPG